MPLLAIAGLFAMQGMLGKHPFEIYVAPAEIATGPMVEMGGKFLGGLFVMQCFQLYTARGAVRHPVSGRRGELGDLPGQKLRGTGHPVTLAMLFPRYRTEDVVRLMWKWPVMLGLLGLAFIVR